MRHEQHTIPVTSWKADCSLVQLKCIGLELQMKWKCEILISDIAIVLIFRLNTNSVVVAVHCESG